MTKKQHQEILDAIGGVNIRVGRVEAGLSDLRTDVTNMAATIWLRFGQVDARLDKVDARLDKVDARLDKVEARIGGVEGRLGSLEQKVDQHYVGLVGHLHRIYGELTGRLGDIEQSRGETPPRATGGRLA